MKNLWRLLRLHQICHRYGLDTWLLSHTNRSWWLWFNGLLPWLWFVKRQSHTTTPHPDLVRQALEEAGTLFIKFGQALSTRPDLLSNDLAQSLSQLQDQCQPFDANLAKAIVEQELGRTLEQLFCQFDDEPISAASIAQVHGAVLKENNQPVVVKIVRPDIEHGLTRDIALLHRLARLAMTLSPMIRLTRADEVVREFEHTLLDELDMMHEAANASTHKRNWKQSDLLYVPDTYWAYTSNRVLVQERIVGIPVNDKAALLAAGINLKQLSENGVSIFFTQVFIHNFFHADMHPGNIFVLPDGRYAGVDFGVMGSLTEADQRYLAENLMAFFNQDYQQVAKLHIESGWVNADTRVDELTAAFRAVSEPILDRPLKDISFGLLLVRLFKIARRFGMTVQPQLVLLEKTILAIEGLGRQLDGNLDLTTTAKPFLENWMKRKLGVKALIKETRRKLPYWLEKLPDMPELVDQQLRQAKSNHQQQIQLQQQHNDLLQQQTRQRRQQWLGLGLLLLAVTQLVPNTLPYWLTLILAFGLLLKT